MNAPLSQHRIVIDSVGLVTPLGHSAWQTFTALLAGRHLSDRASRLPDDIDPIEMVRALGCVSIAQLGADPAVLLAEQAAREATAGVATTQRVDCIIGASKGAITAWNDAMRLVGPVSNTKPTGLTRPHVADAPLATALGPMGYLSHHFAHRLNINITRNIVAACASSLLAVDHARRQLLCATHDTSPSRMLVVTSEAALLPAFIHSYCRLGVLPPLKPLEYVARPLDGRRCGFMLCEIGAAALLRRLPPGEAPKAGEIELLNTATANESHDLIRHAPGMPSLRRMAGDLLRGHHIDLLHPHATGTLDHDPEELTALAAALDQPTMPDVYAAKGAIGHGLGASGLASLVIAYLCARAGRRPPMPWLREPIASAYDLREHGSAATGYRTHAVFAGGFGGHLAGAVIRKCEA